MTLFDVPLLAGVRPDLPRWTIRRADAADTATYRRLRRASFVDEQRLFTGSDRDDADDDPRTVVLVAVAPDGVVVGGVRLAPATARDIGWWAGSRLVVAPGVRGAGGLGPALVREACRTAEAAGVLRFDATVQDRYAPMFRRLGWTSWGATVVGGAPHTRMRWPIDRIRALALRTKASLAMMLDPAGAAWADAPAASLGGDGFVGDDGAPVPGSDLVAACDAILPAMLDADPEWAGWCGVLVNVNDLAAMGAAPVGLLDAVAGRDAATVKRVVNGLRSAADAWGVPLLGGHTQLGVAPALAVTALGRTAAPVRGGGGRRGDEVRLTADLSGGWRPGATGQSASGQGETGQWKTGQWDSTSVRSGAELRALGRVVADAAPRAAKDVSMAGVVGTLGMLAEASGTGAEVEVAAVPTPAAATTGDWLTCFPGFAMVTADAPGTSRMATPLAATAAIGRLTAAPGVRLVWPDGEATTALPGAVTGLGLAAAGPMTKEQAG